MRQLKHQKEFRLACLFSLLVSTALLTPFQATAAESSKTQSLDQAASDPTASLMNVQIQDNYSESFHKLFDASSNSILLRSAVPFQIGEQKHIARATLPIVTDSPSGETGISDLVLFDLLAFDKSWGRWGAGVVGLAPTAAHDALGAGKWAIGPAFGFVARSHKALLGIFNQNLFSFAGDDDREDLNISIVQPIVNYALPNKWSIGTSDMSITYDWDASNWTSLPLGIKLNKLVRFGKQPVQFSGSYEANFADDVVSPESTVNFSMKFLFPI